MICFLTLRWKVKSNSSSVFLAGNLAALIRFSPPWVVARGDLCCEQGLQELLIAPGFLPRPLSQARKRSGRSWGLQCPEERCASSEVAPLLPR